MEDVLINERKKSLMDAEDIWDIVDGRGESYEGEEKSPLAEDRGLIREVGSCEG